MEELKKYVVVSTNNNPDYYLYAPFLEKAWNKYGWTLVVMVTQDVRKADLLLTNPETLVFDLPDIDGVRPESIAQAGRLYAANHLPDDSFIMTSDMDMLPLSDYWKPKQHETTIYGHDLTDYSFYPMGYIAQPSGMWKFYMNLTGNTKEDMTNDSNVYSWMVKSPDWEKWWNWDWQMITDRMRPFADRHTFINRGRRLTGTFAYGRIDRGDSMQIPPNETLIDAHCENFNTRHPDKLNKFISIFESVYGKL